MSFLVESFHNKERDPRGAKEDALLFTGETTGLKRRCGKIVEREQDRDIVSTLDKTVLGTSIIRGT